MTRHQILLKIEVPSGAKPLWASEFREMLASGADGSPLLPPEFFHYGPNGHPLPGKPDIRIIGGGGKWVGVLSQAGESRLIDAAMGTAARIVGERYGQPVPVVLQQPRFGIVSPRQGDGGVHTYHLRDMVVKRRTNVRRNKSDADLARDMILHGLEEIAGQYQFDLPPARALGLRVHDDLRTIGMYLQTTAGRTKEAASLMNATFSIRADLLGVWQVGQMQARGYGRIIPVAAGAHVGRSPAERKGVIQ